MNIITHKFAMLVSLLATFVSFQAGAVPINLNDFFADPEITVSADGSSAEFQESPFSTFVQLTNDPFLGDPQVIIPAASTILTFDYSFNEAAGDSDEFSAYLFDATIGSLLGVLDSLTLSNSASGSYSFDLSPFAGLDLGLQFELFDLAPLAGSLDSTATVSNLELNRTIVTGVPEPTPFLLLGFGLLVLSGMVKVRA